mmetsp:Transcript_3835/g.8114  ORF Transcript_3835/g.8114 Transcript_3835/m.8114 type:complete len:163 (-) Transcript_3835:7-495(-)
MGTQDKFIQCSMLIDPIFIYALNPSEFSLFRWLNFQNRLEDAAFSDGAYFNLLAICYCFVVIWVVFTVILVSKGFDVAVDIQFVCAAFLRVFSFVLILALMTTFDCSEAASKDGDPELTDAVMDVDCFSHCWRGKHLVYSVLSSTVLFFFITLSIPFRVLGC